MQTSLPARRLAGILFVIFIATLIAWAMFLFQTVPTARAATNWHVTSTADGAANLANCPGATSCRLRDAIAKAVSGDTIDFALSFPAVITLTAGELVFSTNLTINGSPTSTLTINANNASRVFETSGKVSMSNMTIRNGNALGGDGGGIATVGTLTLTNAIVISNTAVNGGGIYNSGGILVFTAVTVSNNLATSNGGGVNNSGAAASLTMSNSLVTNNNVDGGSGGGIWSNGPVTITGGSVLSNTAGTGACGSCTGGGIYKSGASRLTLTNVNVSGNKALGTDSHAPGVHSLGGSILVINGGTISNNAATDMFSEGGGIYHVGTGTATISGTMVYSNTAGFGGGIASGNFSTMTVMNATIISNTARFGGGINNPPDGRMTVSGSTIRANIAAEFGGGISNDGPLTVTNSIISYNQTTGGGLGGGGIFNGNAMTITNSTISSNQSSTSGGGIFEEAITTATLTHVTVTSNSATGWAGGIQANGLFTVTNSIIAGNPLPSGSQDCSGTMGSGGYNVLGNNDSCTFIAAGTDQIGTNASPKDPKLTPLAWLGGATQTHGLLSGSPALNQIPSATNGCGTTYTTDQRGFARPATGGTACDIGAYEGTAAALYLPLIIK